MKKLLSLCALLTGMLFSFSSCNNDDEPGNPGNNTPPQTVVEQFYSQFPNAQNVTWETQASGYYIASFTTPEHPQGSTKAWFSNEGKWGMTHYEISFRQLPEAIRTAFSESTYGQSGSGWQADDEVDVLQRNGTETLYVIEVQKKENGTETEVELYYTEAGILVKEIADSDPNDDYEGYLPQLPEGNIQAWLAASKYKDAKIVDMEREDNGTEVELIYEGRKVEIFFDRNQQWVYTKTEYGRKAQELVPANILAAVQASEEWQNGYNRIDDIDFYETQQAGNYYCFELEGTFDNDCKVYIDENGQQLTQRPNPGGNEGQSGVPVEGDIQSFIDTRYPGAVIVEKEYDHGLLEVEIRHDNREKTVKFNGSNEWVMTEWEVRTNELPAAVTSAIATNGYTLDDNEADYVETPDSQWYEVEVRQGRQEVKLYISPDGNILRTENDD